MPENDGASIPSARSTKNQPQEHGVGGVDITQAEYVALKAIQYAAEALFRTKDQREWDAAEHRLRIVVADARRDSEVHTK